MCAPNVRELQISSCAAVSHAFDFNLNRCALSRIGAHALIRADVSCACLRAGLYELALLDLRQQRRAAGLVWCVATQMRHN